MRHVALFSTALSALSSVGPQILGLLLLTSFDFGIFSVVYLIFGLALSVTFSVLCDPWVILRGKKSYSDELFSAVLACISIIFAVFGAIVAQIAIRDVYVSVAASVCIPLAIYRIGARYFLVSDKRWKVVLQADITSIAAFGLGAGFAFALNVENIYVVFAAWACSSVGGSVFGPYPVCSPSSCLRWFKENGKTIRPLLADSSAMDASAVGTPFILLPVLGVQGFGIYRAISNLSAPVRLLLAPARPIIISSSSRLLGLRGLGAVFTSAISFGVLAWVALNSLGRLDGQLGVLTELAPYGRAAGLYVFGAVLLSVFPLVVRAQSNKRLLFIGRINQLALGILGPLLGFALSGLGGAIGGFALSTSVSGLAWFIMSLSFLRTKRSRGPGNL